MILMSTGSFRTVLKYGFHMPYQFCEHMLNKPALPLCPLLSLLSYPLYTETSILAFSPQSFCFRSTETTTSNNSNYSRCQAIVATTPAPYESEVFSISIHAFYECGAFFLVFQYFCPQIQLSELSPFCQFSNKSQKSLRPDPKQ